MTAGSTLMRVSPEEYESSESFPALMLCAEKHHQVGGEKVNTPESKDISLWELFSLKNCKDMIIFKFLELQTLFCLILLPPMQMPIHTPTYRQQLT